MSIKRFPEDFQVLEIQAPAFQAELQAEKNAFAVYRIKKINLTTPEAVLRLAKKWGLRSGAFAYAGLKDKHALTVQVLTVKQEDLETPLPEKYETPDLTADRIGFLSRPISSDDIQGNRFRVTARALSEAQSAKMEQRVRFLSAPGETTNDWALRAVNYFGDQRFGSARHQKGFLAKNLIRGEFEEALKLAVAVPARKDRRDRKEFARTLNENWGNWEKVLPDLKRCPERAPIEHLEKNPKDFRGAFEKLPYFFRQLCVFAYQSWIWNEIAAEFISQTWKREDLIERADPFGRLLFPKADQIPAELAELDLPILGKNSRLEEPWKKAAERVLNREGIATAALSIPGIRRPFFGEARRRFFLEAEAFSFSPPEPDETASSSNRFKRIFSFTLPRGAYATIILRALGH